MMTLDDAARMLPGARARRRARRRRSRACTATRAALRRATSSSPCAASASTPTTSSPTRKAAGAVAALAERGLDEAGAARPRRRRQPARPRRARRRPGARRFALPLDRGHRQQRQDHGDADDRVDLARLASATRRSRPQGNFNNDIGLPLTLLRLRDGCRAAVVELGMNHAGEIAAPGAASPRRRSRSSTTRSASTTSSWRRVEAVARENGAAIAALGDDGVAVFPADDAHAADLARASPARAATMTFALARRRPTSPAAPTGTATTGSWRCRRRPARRASRCTSPAAQRPQRAGRERRGARRRRARSRRSRAAWKLRRRSRPLAGEARSRAPAPTVTLIDDTYNANPDSVRAAIDVLAALPAPRWLVLGDMGEVGDQGPAFHREVGAYAKRARHRVALGGGRGEREHGAPFAGARALRRRRGAASARSARRRPAASVLVKGSRFMRWSASSPRSPASRATRSRQPTRRRRHAA